MVVVKPNDKKAPDPTAKSPLPELGFDPLGIKERQEEAQIAKNKDLIRAKYYQLKDLLGDYATIKNQFYIRGKYFPPESYFQAPVYAGGVAEAAAGVAETVAAGVLQGIATQVPRLAQELPNNAPLLDPVQQTSLLRTMSDVFYEITTYFKNTPSANPKNKVAPASEPAPIVNLPATVTIPPEILRPSRPVRIRTRDLQTNLKPIGEEVPSRPLRYTGIITKEDYSDYKKPDTSSSIDISNSSSSSSSRPNNISTNMSESIDRLFDYIKPSPMQNLKPDKSIRQQHIDDENKEIEMSYSKSKGKPNLTHQEKPEYHKPTQDPIVASSTLSILNALLTGKRGLARIKAEKGKTTPENKYIKNLIRDTWKHNKPLQSHILGLLNLYGITVKSKYMPGEVVKVVEKLMGQNAQVVNTFMNELIKILENDSRNKLKFIFEPVATDSGTLAVQGADPITTSINLRDPVLRKTVIDKLEEGKVPEEVAAKWYDTLVETINQQNHKRFGELGYEQYEKNRENSLKLLHDNIIARLKELADSNKLVFNNRLITELVELIFDTFKTPITLQVFQEIITTPVFEVVSKLDPRQEAGPIEQYDMEQANRDLQTAMFGNRIYYDTIFRWQDLEIVKAPNHPEQPPDDPDDPNPVITQYYWFRYKGRHWLKVNVRVLMLIISVISATPGIAYKIIKAIKDEHKKDLGIPNEEPEPEPEPEPTDTTNKEKTKPKKDNTYVRPKRTKRHGELP